MITSLRSCCRGGELSGRWPSEPLIARPLPVCCESGGNAELGQEVWTGQAESCGR